MIDGRRVVVELLDKSGRRARLLVTAPRDVLIARENRISHDVVEGDTDSND